MKFKLLIIFTLAFSLLACENEEFIADDFGTENVYFPFQTPVRTIIQGKYDLGFNDNDNAGKFQIGVRMSGVIENKEDRKVHFELAPELIDAATLGVDTVNVKILPSSYYTIEQQSPITIRSGATDGRVTVQLQDAFFDDPQSFAEFGEVHYVIPLKITRIEKLDSILSGSPIVTNPIKINNEHWNPLPKDYTLFGIKYINKFHGNYLRRGADRIVGASEVFTASTGVTETIPIDTTTVYRAEYVTRDEVVPVTTSGRNNVSLDTRVRRAQFPSPENPVKLNLVIDGNNDITVTSEQTSDFQITGTGKFVENGDEWGGEKRDVIYLEYQYSDVQVVEEFFFGSLTKRSSLNLNHIVNDTLVIRNRNVKFEEFTIDLEKSN
ncbi:DUF5627 domain-containing protein [Polaribacter septentrionalilitoris]|uniref:DUF5627 domain-containing protein n=1 Tax=Polaribacter septentrionalilitoris TaxID=2494657 RepID=UPI00135B4461|nr:DUF5627 domain-containing protein [Polaribacter septentrionalilitoris]